jgi:hypothetical protein
MYSKTLAKGVSRPWVNAKDAQGVELAEDTAVDEIARDLRAREKTKSKA